MPRALPWLRRVAVAVVAWAAGHLAVISLDGCSDDDVTADVAVVLGNAVTPDGRPSPRLQRRLDRALELYRAGKVARILVSGGQDPGSPHEADVMRDDLVARGVPPGLVVVDRGGVNTYETARFAAEYLRAHGLRSIVAVSQFYHLTRCKLALRRFGAPEVYAAHAAVELELRDPWSLLRELVGYYAYLAKDYPSTPP